MNDTERAERAERIQQMEELLDSSREALDALNEALHGYIAAQRSIYELNAYYGSDEWYADREADSRGELPAELRRGVLSEDLIYDVITDNRELALMLLKAAARYIDRG